MAGVIAPKHLARPLSCGVVSPAPRPVTGSRTSRASAPQAGGVGFGKSQGAKPKQTDNTSGSYITSSRKTRVTQELERNQEDASPSGAPVSATAPERDLAKGNWFDLATVGDFAGEKKRKLVELKGNKKMVVLHMYKDQIYAMDAYSTAYQYPLLDGKVEDGATGPTIETPLDGTVYDLKTGAVVKWCPPNGSPIRGLLSSLKGGVKSVPLPVYPVVVKPDGKVAVRLSK